MATTTYIVKSGDTLSAIAKAHGVTLKQILDANPKFTTDPKFKNGNMIWAGTVVKIPTKNTTKPAPKPTPPKPTTPPAPTPVAPEPKPVYDAPRPVYPTPEDVYYPPTPRTTPEPEAPPVKSAPIDTVEFIDETLSAELIADLLFEDVGGQELLSITREDTVNGQSVIYQPIKNLGILQEIYNPTSLLQIQDTSDRFFSNFTIDLKSKIPAVGSGENGANYYRDPVTGDGIIELINMRADEQVEVQIASAGIIEEAGI